MSVSDRKNESPTVIADAFALFRASSEGVLTFSLPFSTAVLNRTQIIEFALISSSTLGTVAWFSPMEKGLNPAKKADVSKTITCSVGGFLWIFSSHSFEQHSALQSRVEFVFESDERGYVL